MTFTDGFEQDRIGWREITATGAGVRLADATVPESSVSGELRRYPDDLLTSPLDQRTASFTVSRLGAGTGTPTSGTPRPLRRRTRR
ncbi:hypothetical protein ACFSTC_46010 [Nonomuraea ferruginea]